MSPAARASGGDCDCCGRAVARSFNRPRLLAPRAARRPSVRPSRRRHHSNLLPVYVIFACCLLAGSALLTGGGGDHVTVARVPARPLSPRAWSPTGDIEIQFPYSRNSSWSQLRRCICFLIHKCLRLSRPLSRVPYGQMEGRPDRWLVPSFAPLLVNTLEATGDGDGGPGIGETREEEERSSSHEPQSGEADQSWLVHRPKGNATAPRDAYPLHIPHAQCYLRRRRKKMYLYATSSIIHQSRRIGETFKTLLDN